MTSATPLLGKRQAHAVDKSGNFTAVTFICHYAIGRDLVTAINGISSNT